MSFLCTLYLNKIRFNEISKMYFPQESFNILTPSSPSTFGTTTRLATWAASNDDDDDSLTLHEIALQESSREISAAAAAAAAGGEWESS